MARLTIILSAFTAVIALLGGFRLLMGRIREMQWRKQTTGKWLLLLALFLMPSVAEAAGNEARCDELGAACKCSEPLQATAYTGWPGQSNSVYWNPNDTTTKQCPGQFAPSEGEVGYAIFRGDIGEPFDFTPSSDATILNAFPAGHSVTRVLKSPSGYTGGFAIDNTWDAGNVEAARRAIRFYSYLSSDYTLVDSDDANRGCNGKFFQATNDVKIDRGYGGSNIYNFRETVPDQDCCTVGPYPTDGAFVNQYSTQSGYGSVVHGTDVTDNYWNGRWFRIEVVMVNTDASAGNGKHWRMQAYVKNVTDNWSEVMWFDTVDTDQLAVSGLPLDPVRYGLQPFNNMHVNGYRQAGTSPGCVGYSAWSHFLAASWDTDSGQRIGAASEIEGGAAFVPTITMFIEAAPVVAGMLWHFRQAILSGMLAVWMMGGAVLALTTQKTRQISYTAATKTMQGVNKVLEKVNRS